MNLCEFLDVEELDDVVLNAGNQQRLVLVAAHFRKEVTTAVLWLLGHGVRAQCFRIVPYSFGGEIFLDLQQILPTRETAEYTIGMAAKDSEEKTVRESQEYRNRRRQAFWTKALRELRARNVARFEDIRPSKDSSLTCAAGAAGCRFALVFLKGGARVELYFAHSEATNNKWLFDRLEGRKREFEDRFGHRLHWQRLDDRTASRISYSHPFDSYDESSWEDMIDWMCRHMGELFRTFSDPLVRLDQEQKSRSDGRNPAPLDPAD